MNKKILITMPFKTYTYRVYPNNGGGWSSRPWQRGDGIGGWQSLPYQRGDGIGSFIARMSRKFLPVAGKLTSKALKTIKSSKALKDVGNVLLDRGLESITELASNAIDPNKNTPSASETAQLRLDQARNDIAKIIRGNGNDSDTDEDSDSYSIPDIPIKRKRPRAKKQQKKSKRKKYNLLKNIKNGK